MATEATRHAGRDIGPGGEEIVEIEKGVKVRKSGGVEFAPTLSATEFEARRSELTLQIDHQKTVIARAREEAANAARQANEQEILAREALEFKEYNKNRQNEAAVDAKALMVEVTALVEKEKELERQRAATHRAAVEKESERVKAKTAEVISREEALEAEKREQYHYELIRKCQALTLRYKLEEEQAKLKLESLQFSLQHGELRTGGAANRATIVVEVEPRELPEARQFDTSQVEPGVASAVMAEEGVATVAEVRSIEEIVTEDRKSRATSSTFISSRGGVKSEEIYGRTGEGMVELGREEFHSSAPMGGPYSSDIKILPDIKQTPPAVSEASPHMPSQQVFSSGAQQQAMQPEYSAQQQLGNIQQQGQQGVQQGVQQASSQTAAAATSEASHEKKKSSGFFKKFKPTKSHEQH